MARPVTLGRVTLAPLVPAVGTPGSISGSRQKPPLHAPTGAGRERAIRLNGMRVHVARPQGVVA